MKYHLFLISAMVIVGSSVTVGKVVVSDLPVYLSLTVRFFIGALFMYGFIRFRRRPLFWPGMRVLSLVALQAMLGSVLFTVFILEGIRLSSAVSAGILTGTLPVVIFVFSIFIFSEKLNLLKVLAVLAAAFGVMLVNISGAGSSGSTIKGTLLVLSAIVCEALFLLLRKKISLKISTITLAYLVSLFGFLFFLPFGIYEAYAEGFSKIDFAGYMVIVYYGIFVTAVAYILWFEGVGRVAGIYASVYTSFMPLSAVVLSSILLGEELTVMHLGELAFIMSAVFTLLFAKR